MADSAQDRHLPASAKKLQKARGEGQVARSRDWGHFVSIGVGGALIVSFGPWLVDWLREILLEGLRFDARSIRDPGFMGERLQAQSIRMLWVVLPAGFAMLATGVAATLVIGGWNWTLKPLAPNFGKLNVVAGLGGLFTKDKLVDLGKATLMASVLGAIGVLYFRAHLDTFAGLIGVPLPAAIHQGAGAMVGGVTLMVLALAAFAAFDVFWQRHQHAERLKMSHQERKQEAKEAEGSPEAKQRIKQRMREMTRKRMLAAVPKADLVVMNPTHYAVALKYDDTMGAPRVVAKGADLIAMKIRDLANDHRVPVLQAPVLARALYAHAELDREIPAALFGAVAQVLAYVYQLKAALAGHGKAPAGLPELNVPRDLDPHQVAP